MALPGGNDIEFKLVKNCMDTNKEYIKKGCAVQLWSM